MYPTYKNKQLISSNIFENKNNLQTGDIITFYSGLNYISNIYIKRVIGVPGDTIQIKEGIVYINGEQEPFNFPKIENAGSAETPITLKDNEYFVLGDNRNYSNDSRVIGVVKKSHIIGIVEKYNK